MKLLLTTILRFRPKVFKNCAELYKSGQKTSGVYTIDPDGAGSFDMFCEQTTVGGGWTVFQKRLYGSVDLYQGWVDYKRGFGNLNGEFWLGLDKISRLTNSQKGISFVSIWKKGKERLLMLCTITSLTPVRRLSTNSVLGFTQVCSSAKSWHPLSGIHN